MNIRIVSVIAILLAFAACKAGNKDSTVEDMLLTSSSLATPVDIRITGKVTCDVCKPTYSMMIEVWDADPEASAPLNSPPWMGDFNEGEFSVDLKARPGEDIEVKAYVAGDIMHGPGVATTKVPESGALISNVLVEIP